MTCWYVDDIKSYLDPIVSPDVDLLPNIGQADDPLWIALVVIDPFLITGSCIDLQSIDDPVGKLYQIDNPTIDALAVYDPDATARLIHDLTDMTHQSDFQAYAVLHADDPTTAVSLVHDVSLVIVQQI